MPSRLKDNLKNNPQWHHRTHLQNMELEWAHVFHDSIRGKSWLESLPLNIGRWAGNYSYFYVLCRLLNDYQPANIIEFGVGESSKVVSAFLENQLLESRHVILEENEQWAAAFSDRFTLGGRSEIKLFADQGKAKRPKACRTTATRKLRRSSKTPSTIYIWLMGPKAARVVHATTSSLQWKRWKPATNLLY